MTVVGLVADDNDRRLLANLSFDNGWIMHFVDSSAEAQAASARLRVPVILYDRDLPSADWRDIVSLLASSSLPTCVILISRVADDHLWEEVIRRGGYEVLSKPLRPEEVVRMIKLAWSFWNSMMKMPAYAGKRSASNSRELSKMDVPYRMERLASTCGCDGLPCEQQGGAIKHVVREK